MNSRSISMAFLSITLLLTLITSTAFGQEGPFEDSFDDPSLPGWEHTPNVYVTDGLMRLEPGGYASPGGVWGAYELVILLRYEGEGNMAFMYNLSNAGGSILLYDGSRFEFQLESAGTIEVIGEPIPYEIPPREWFQFTFLVTEDTQTVLVNDARVIELPLGAPLSVGGVGVETHGDLTLDMEYFTLIPTEVPIPAPPEEPAPTETSGPPSADRPPAYQVSQWTHLGGPIGGLGYDIRHSFENPDIWYVTDAWAGIHRSMDNGLTWQPINQGITAVKGVDAIPIFSATVDPHDSDVVWIGTEGSGQIYRTSDGGDTWVEMSNGIDPSLRPLTFRGFTIDPNDQDTVFAMGEISSPAWTPDGEQRAGLEMDLTKGIVYKTTDGGKHWAEVWRGDNLARYAWINPEDTNIVYVSTGIFDRESANTNVAAGEPGGVGILKSTDGGKSWHVFDQSNGLMDLYIGSLYMHPTDPDTLLAAASQNNWSAYHEDNTAGIFLTHDGGESWERVLSGEELFATVEYCQSDPSIAYAASAQAVYRSQDAGETWERFGRPDNTWGPPGIIAGLPIDMQCDPDDPDRIFVNNYGGGNFLSEDGGKSWIDASQGYSGALIRDIAIVSGEPGWVYSSGRSGVFRSTDGGTTWTGLANPGADFRGIAMTEIGALAVNPHNPLALLTAPGDLGNAIVSLDGGNSWSQTSGITGPPIQLAYAPGDPTIAYAAVTHLGCVESIRGDVLEEMCREAQNTFYASSDGGLTWTNPAGANLPGDGFTQIVVHPQNAQTIYGGSLSQGVLISSDGGQTWREISNGLPPGEIISALALDPSDPMRLYVSYRERGLYKTINGGANWTRVSRGLIPEAYIKSIVVDPSNSNIVYLADHLSGVYLSTNAGETWSPMNNELTHRTANVLAISDDGTVLYVGIEGGGVFRLGNPPPVEGADQLITIATPQTEEQLEETEGEQEPPVDDSQEVEDKGPGFTLPCPGTSLSAVFLLIAYAAVIRNRQRFLDHEKHKTPMKGNAREIAEEDF